MFALEFLDRRLDSLQASVERTRVYTERLRMEIRTRHMFRKLMGLAHAMRRQGRVCWITGWCWKLRPVGTSAEVDRPIEPML